jgi:biopolymer transport protein ExbB
MRERILWSGFLTALCVLLLWSSLPAALSVLSLGPRPAAAAPEDDLEAKSPTAAKSPAEKSAPEKVLEDDASAKAPADGGATQKKENFLVWLYASLKFRYTVIFLILTFNAVALIVMIVLGLRRGNICPDDLAAAFESKLNEKKYQEAYELAKSDKSLLGKVLAAGMSKLSEGYEAVDEAMRETGDEQSTRLEQRNGYIALIAQIGPMFGLLGTVDGMVMAFDLISQKNITPKPSELAVGIGTALVTTIVGLWIAIPLMIFYHVVRNRLSRLLLEVGAVSNNLMKRFNTLPTAKKV